MERIQGTEEEEEGNSGGGNPNPNPNRCQKQQQQQQVVVDGSEIAELVENEEAFSNFVEYKFEQLDKDRDGKLSVKELQPAVTDIGAALGLPTQGASPDSDHIYSEVLNEFTHGKEHKVSKTKFKDVFADILLGVADGLKRDPIAILRLDGQDLLDLINSSTFELEMIAMFHHFDLTEGSLQHHITKAFEQLTVDQGMPPSSDPWVKSNIVELALQICLAHDDGQHVSEETFLKELKRVTECICQHLKDQPVIVAHTENTFDGNRIKRLLSNKFELEKLLDAATKELPKDRHQKLPKGYLLVALNVVAPSAGLPPYGAVEQVDKLVKEALQMVKAEDGKLVGEVEFKKLMVEILASLMLQLQSDPISVSSDTVVHEPMRFSSSLLS